jgi:hypothetical protein
MYGLKKKLTQTEVVWNFVGKVEEKLRACK